MSLKDVLKKIQELKPVAAEDVDSGAPETMNARRGRKRQAQEQIKILTREYSRRMLETSVFVVSTGGGRTQLEQLLTSTRKWFAADTKEFYTSLAEKVHPELYLNKESNSSLFETLSRHLEDKMLELDVNAYPQMIFKQHYRKTINNTKEFTSLVQQAINEQIGSEIVGLQAVHSLLDKAIEQGHDGPWTPILLSTSDEALALNLLDNVGRFSKNVFLAVTGRSSSAIKAVPNALVLKEATDESIKPMLSSIEQTLKR